MRIVTFGSCLARLTSIQLMKRHGGELVSSCYHMRSDAFVGRFIEQDWVEYPIELIEATFGYPARRAGNVDENHNVILQNQYPKTMGSHRLENFTPFLDALQSSPDIIIADNHIDIGGRLVARRQDEKAGIFSLLSRSPENSDWELRDRLPIEDGVRAMKKVLGFFRKKAPNAAIIFINFPHNTYVGNTLRIERTLQYERLFSFDDGLVIPCRHVPEEQWSPDPQHFRSGMYMTLAKEISEYLLSSKYAHLAKEKPKKVKKTSEPVAHAFEDAAKEIDSLYRSSSFERITEIAAKVDDEKLPPRIQFMIGYAFLKIGEPLKAYRVFDKAADMEPVHKPSLERAIALASKHKLDRDLANLLARHQAVFPDDHEFRMSFRGAEAVVTK